ncbi:MAG: hypothetical protein WAS27_00900 [Candidatus Saccharimonadales bacterium]
MRLFYLILQATFLAINVGFGAYSTLNGDAAYAALSLGVAAFILPFAITAAISAAHPIN